MIRLLEEKDAPFMLEWMHDEAVNCYFQYPFKEMTIEKVKDFINNSFGEENRHFAIVDVNDEYLGTISLKNISYKNRNAEYAIVTRRKAQGTGAARKATQELLEYALEELHLHKIYLNVLEKNIRARKFYEKCGFVQEGIARDAVMIKDKYESLVWYGIVNGKDETIIYKITERVKK